MLAEHRIMLAECRNVKSTIWQIYCDARARGRAHAPGQDRVWGCAFARASGIWRGRAGGRNFGWLVIYYPLGEWEQIGTDRNR